MTNLLPPLLIYIFNIKDTLANACGANTFQTSFYVDNHKVGGELEIKTMFETQTNIIASIYIPKTSFYMYPTILRQHINKKLKNLSLTGKDVSYSVNIPPNPIREISYHIEMHFSINTTMSPEQAQEVLTLIRILGD